MKLQYQPEGAQYWCDCDDCDAIIAKISRETRYGTEDQVRAMLKGRRTLGCDGRWYRDSSWVNAHVESVRAETASDMRKCGVCRKMVHSSQMLLGGICADCD
jgi:hypothetical protein